MLTILTTTLSKNIWHILKAFYEGHILLIRKLMIVSWFFLKRRKDIILSQNIRDFNSHEFIYDSNCLSLLSLPRCLIKISSTLFQVCASRRNAITHAATRIKSHPCNAYTSSTIHNTIYYEKTTLFK